VSTSLPNVAQTLRAWTGCVKNYLADARLTFATARTHVVKLNAHPARLNRFGQKDQRLRPTFATFERKIDVSSKGAGTPALIAAIDNNHIAV
jgi:hypothetical protein